LHSRPFHNFDCNSIVPESGVITGKGEAEIFESGMNELGGNEESRCLTA